MKKIKFVFLGIGLILLGSCAIFQPRGSSGGSSTPSINIDSLAQVRADSIIKHRLGDIDLGASYQRPISNNIFMDGNNLKDEAYVLPGMIMRIRKQDDKFILEETGYFVRKPDSKLDVEIKVDKPFFKSVVDKGFSSNVDAMSSVTASLTAKEKVLIEYKTLQTVILKPLDIDIKKADSLITVLSESDDDSVQGYFIIRSANLNIFTFSKFSKLEGSAQANGMAFQAGADMFYESSDDNNSFEIVLKGISKQKSDNKINSEPELEWKEYVSNTVLKMN